MLELLSFNPLCPPDRWLLLLSLSPSPWPQNEQQYRTSAILTSKLPRKINIFQINVQQYRTSELLPSKHPRKITLSKQYEQQYRTSAIPPSKTHSKITHFLTHVQQYHSLDTHTLHKYTIFTMNFSSHNVYVLGILNSSPWVTKLQCWNSSLPTPSVHRTVRCSYYYPLPLASTTGVAPDLGGYNLNKITIFQ